MLVVYWVSPIDLEFCRVRIVRGWYKRTRRIRRVTDTVTIEENIFFLFHLIARVANQ